MNLKISQVVEKTDQKFLDDLDFFGQKYIACGENQSKRPFSPQAMYFRPKKSKNEKSNSNKNF